MDITLTCNGRDFSGRLSAYSVEKLVETVHTITTLDGVEHIVQRTRDQITFKLIPFSDAVATADFTALSALQFSATYTDPNKNTTSTKTLRVASDLNAAFGIKSVDGNRYYKGGNIVLRAISPN
ncbi:MAG: hypothetical protein J6Y20_01100 [Lachnospiraceae bacterium]|nr:hypothetical protein [Lachnospiraceae bacterium]